MCGAGARMSGNEEKPTPAPLAKSAKDAAPKFVSARQGCATRLLKSGASPPEPVPTLCPMVIDPTMTVTPSGTRAIRTARGNYGHGCGIPPDGCSHCKPARPPFRSRVLYEHGAGHAGDGLRRFCPHLLSCRTLPGAAAQPNHSYTRRGVFLLDSVARRSNFAGLRRPSRYSSALGRSGVFSGMSHDCSRCCGRNRCFGSGCADGPGSTNVLHYWADRYPDLCGLPLFRLPLALEPARAQAIHLHRHNCTADSRDRTLAVRFCIPEVFRCSFGRR
jgi:hypothetical protein